MDEEARRRRPGQQSVPSSRPGVTGARPRTVTDGEEELGLGAPLDDFRKRGARRGETPRPQHISKDDSEILTLGAKEGHSKRLSEMNFTGLTGRRNVESHSQHLHLDHLDAEKFISLPAEGLLMANAPGVKAGPSSTQALELTENWAWSPLPSGGPTQHLPCLQSVTVFWRYLPRGSFWPAVASAREPWLPGSMSCAASLYSSLQGSGFKPEPRGCVLQPGCVVTGETSPHYKLTSVPWVGGTVGTGLSGPPCPPVRPSEMIPRGAGPLLGLPWVE